MRRLSVLLCVLLVLWSGSWAGSAAAESSSGGKEEPMRHTRSPEPLDDLPESQGWTAPAMDHFRNEPGSTYQRLGWHTDSLRDVFYLEKPRKYLNVGFYLDDSPIEKGGVRLLAGTHNQGIWSMLTRKAHFVQFAPDPEEYAVVAEAGDLTIHDGRIWHRVARATATGDASRRRVMYLPLMEGPLKLKDERSPTPLYHRLKKIIGL